MASNTKQTKNIRRRKAAKLARKNKKERVKAGTPAFPIHPEGEVKANQKTKQD